MNKYCRTWIEEWCRDNGWTDPFKEQKAYWAFPPHAVMPLPIPTQELQVLKARKGMSPAERLGCAVAWVTAVTGAALVYWMESPMPLVMAFGFCAVIFAQMDDD